MMNSNRDSFKTYHWDKYWEKTVKNDYSYLNWNSNYVGDLIIYVLYANQNYIRSLNILYVFC